MRPLLVFMGLIVAGVLACGCQPADKSGAQGDPITTTDVDKAPPLADLPIEMTVAQRTTTAVPGSKTVSLTVDDVTRGQVMVSVIGDQGKAVLGPTSLREGEIATFDLEGTAYTLSISKLHNELLGDDSVTVVISQGALEGAEAADNDSANLAAGAANSTVDATAAEIQKIALLIEHIESLDGAVFIRNGEEHAPAEAAEHLRRKLSAVSDESMTAQEFIELAASKSSLTGEPYRIRLKDGTEFAAGEYLRQQLANLK